MVRFPRSAVRFVIPAVMLVAFVAPALAGNLQVQAYEGYAAFKSGDHAEAYRLLKPVAAEGHRGARVQLAYLYEYGLGVEADPERADELRAQVRAEDEQSR